MSNSSGKNGIVRVDTNSAEMPAKRSKMNYLIKGILGVPHPTYPQKKTRTEYSDIFLR